MTDPRYPGWDHPTTEPEPFWPVWNPDEPYASRRRKLRSVLALVIGVVVVIVGGLWWVRG